MIKMIKGSLLVLMCALTMSNVALSQNITVNTDRSVKGFLLYDEFVNSDIVWTTSNVVYESFHFSINDSIFVHNYNGNDSQVYKITDVETVIVNSELRMVAYTVLSSLSGYYYTYVALLNSENEALMFLIWDMTESTESTLAGVYKRVKSSNKMKTYKR